MVVQLHHFSTSNRAVISQRQRDRLWCDLERMERILINLLSNATKFTNAGGNVQVRLMDAREAFIVERLRQIQTDNFSTKRIRKGVYLKHFTLLSAL